MEVEAVSRAVEKVIVDNHIWTVDKVTYFPKHSGRNENESCCGWDDDRNADLTVDLVREW